MNGRLIAFSKTDAAGFTGVDPEHIKRLAVRRIGGAIRNATGRDIRGDVDDLLGIGQPNDIEG